MWWLGRITGLCVLLLFSYFDIKSRKIPAGLLAASSIGAFCYYAVFKEISPWLLIGGIGTGVVFLLVSKVTREGLGYADSWGILALGAYLGLWELLELLFIAFFLLAFFAMAALSVKKMPRRYALPFFPFLTGGYIIVFLETGGVL